MMIGFYLGMIALWLLFCLVFAPKPGRVVILFPVLLPLSFFVSYGRSFFNWLDAKSCEWLDSLDSWLDDFGVRKAGAEHE